MRQCRHHHQLSTLLPACFGHFKLKTGGLGKPIREVRRAPEGSPNPSVDAYIVDLACDADELGITGCILNSLTHGLIYSPVEDSRETLYPPGPNK